MMQCKNFIVCTICNRPVTEVPDWSASTEINKQDVCCPLQSIQNYLIFII